MIRAGTLPPNQLFWDGTGLCLFAKRALSRWEGLTRFIDDGCIELDNNIVERSITPITMGDSLCNPSSSICVFARWHDTGDPFGQSQFSPGPPPSQWYGSGVARPA
jgi:Transposase IS66 family